MKKFFLIVLAVMFINVAPAISQDFEMDASRHSNGGSIKENQFDSDQIIIQNTQGVEVLLILSIIIEAMIVVEKMERLDKAGKR